MHDNGFSNVDTWLIEGGKALFVWIWLSTVALGLWKIF
jgi:hypothetical protein